MATWAALMCDDWAALTCDEWGLLGCGPFCAACPCVFETVPTALSAIFDDWTSSPDGYCSNCGDLNATFEVPAIEVISASCPGGIGDAYSLTSPRVPCAIGAPGEGCRYEMTYDFDCVPQNCLDECTASCEGECTGDSDCEPENCENFLCAGGYLCGAYGPGCQVECEQAMVCVFDEENDPNHEHGSCAAVGECAVSGVVADSCPVVKLVVQAILYVSDDLTPILSVYVRLCSRTVESESTATLLRGWHEFDAEPLDCGEIDVVVDLEPIPDYLQPLVPACGVPTSVRIVAVM